MGAYRSMNVLDGGVVVVVGGEQTNLRVSRSLNGSVDTVCGPLRVRPIEPLKSFEIEIAPGDHSPSGRIIWECVEPAREEHPHYERLHGRTVEDYRRFDQIGVASGELAVGRERLRIDRWWSCRDHSWGVRRGMGVPEPVTGPRIPLGEKGHVMSFLFFPTDTMSGHLLFSGRGDDPAYTTGTVTDRQIEAVHQVQSIALMVDLHEGTRRFRSATVSAVLSGGAVLRLSVDARGAAIAMQDLGYSSGWTDARGLGAWRGEQVIECDVWDVSHPSLIAYPDGTRKEHWHRIQPVGVQADLSGVVSHGTGSMTLTIAGRLPEHLQVAAARASRADHGL